LAVISLFAVMILASSANVFADLLQGSTKQRIGNYDVEITTDPKSPTVDSNPTNVLIRIAGVNGDHPMDVPIMIRLMKDGDVLQTTKPIIVQSGHYTHEFAFTQPGRYILYIDLDDYTYSGEVLTFTFFINVSGSFDYLYIAVPSALALAGTVSLLIFMKRKKEKFKKPARQS
jgi:hypothetical protein